VKRTLVGSTLVSAGAAVFLLAWYAAFDASVPSPPSWPRPRNAARPPATADASPEPCAAPPGPSTGSLRIFAHAGGQALEGVSLDLRGPGQASPRSAASGPDGTADLADLSPGEWTVRARHPRFLPAEARAFVAAGGRPVLAIELRPGGTAHGRVSDREGRPLAGVDVDLLRADGTGPLDPPQTARTGEDGRYRIEGIPLLEWRLRFRSGRHRPWTTERILFRFPGDAHVVDAVLEEDSSSSDSDASRGVNP